VIVKGVNTPYIRRARTWMHCGNWRKQLCWPPYVVRFLIFNYTKIMTMMK